MKLCSLCKLQPTRSVKQRYCKACHAVKMKAWRAAHVYVRIAAMLMFGILLSGCAVKQPAKSSLWITPDGTKVRLKEPCRLENGKPSRGCVYVVTIVKTEVR